MLTRRAILRQILASAIVLPLSPFVSLLVKPANAEPMTIYAIGSGIISLISSFTKSDGGLGAILQSQTEKINLIASQLSEIHESIANLSKKISELPDNLRLIIREQYADELVNELAAAAEQYSTILLARKDDPGVFKDPIVRDLLGTIYNEAWKKRRALSSLEDGIGEKGAIIAPLATALETATLLHLGANQSFLRSTLRSYVEWYDRILGDSSGSIARKISTYASENDKIVKEAIENRNNWALSDFLLNEKSALRGGGTCFIAGSFPVNGTGSNTREVFKNLLNMNPRRRAYSYERLPIIGQYEASEYSANLIKLESHLRVIAVMDESGNVEGFIPEDGVPCTGVGSLGILADTDALITAFEATELVKASFSNDDVLKGYINQINLQRVRIAYAGRARFIAFQARRRVQDTLRELGGK